MVRWLLLGLLDLLLAGVRRAFAWAMDGRAAVLRLWDDAGVRELLFEVLDYLLETFRTLEIYLDRIRTRVRYRIFFEEFTAPMAARYRQRRRG